MQTPLSVTSRHPAFSWQLSSDIPSIYQNCWQIVVTSEDGALMWDSGIQNDSNTIGIPYAGSPLASCTRYLYNISVWNDKDQQSTVRIPVVYDFNTTLGDIMKDPKGKAITVCWLSEREVTMERQPDKKIYLYGRFTSPYIYSPIFSSFYTLHLRTNVLPFQWKHSNKTLHPKASSLSTPTVFYQLHSRECFSSAS